MPVLKNSRHEIIAQAIFKGATNEDAYIKAGYSPKWARSNAAHTLTAFNSISKRISGQYYRLSDIRWYI